MSYNLCVNNKKVFEFYEKHPTINFETMNVLLVDFLQHAMQDATDVASESSISRILSTCADISSKLTLQNDILNARIVDLRQKYMDDMKGVIVNFSNDRSERLLSGVETHTTLLLTQQSDKLAHAFERMTSAFTDRLRTSMSDMNADHGKMLRDLMSYHLSNVCTAMDRLQKDTDASMRELLGRTHAIDELQHHLSSTKQTQLHTLEALINQSFQQITASLAAVAAEHAKTSTEHDRILANLSEYLEKYKNSSHKGALSETKLRVLLNKMYPTAEIADTSGVKESGDCILRRGGNDDSIMFENKEYDTNVNPDEIKKFIRDTTKHDMHGIFISQFSGITSKHNFQIEFNKGKLLVYLHDVQYSPDKIRIAVDMIDAMARVMATPAVACEESITLDALQEFNAEFQRFLTQKQTLQTTLKDFEKRMTTMIADLQMPALEAFLSARFASAAAKAFVCDVCHTFSCDTQKGMAAHKRACRQRISLHVTTASAAASR